MKAQTFQNLLIGALCLTTALLAGIAYQHQQQLADLLTAGAAPQPDPVPALRRQLTQLQEQQTAVQAQCASLAAAQEALASKQAAARNDLEGVSTSLAQLKGLSAEVPSPAAMAAWAQRLGGVEELSGTLAARLKTLESRGNDPVVESNAPGKAHRIRSAAPPFSLLGVESRGSARFLAVLPVGEASLAAVRLLQPEESLAGWQLQRIEAQRAVFRVAGQAERSLPLP